MYRKDLVLWLELRREELAKEGMAYADKSRIKKFQEIKHRVDEIDYLIEHAKKDRLEF